MYICFSEVTDMLNYLSAPLTTVIARNPEMSVAECSYGHRVLTIRGNGIGDGGEHERKKRQDPSHLPFRSFV